MAKWDLCTLQNCPVIALRPSESTEQEELEWSYDTTGAAMVVAVTAWLDGDRPSTIDHSELP